MICLRLSVVQLIGILGSLILNREGAELFLSVERKKQWLCFSDSFGASDCLCYQSQKKIVFFNNFIFYSC